MSHRYLVLGSGMQGSACACYFAKYGDAKQICMADISEDTAQKAADRINQLTRSHLASAEVINVKDHQKLVELMKNYDAVLSAIDYSMNVDITKAAIEAGVHLCDLGGNTNLVREQLKLHPQALEKNISIVPDCGLAPGLGNTLAAYGIELLDECEEVQVRCGDLPQNPKPPLQYKLVFNIRGLTNEYFGKAWILRNSEIQEISTFTECEELEFKSPIGKCEAFVTTGGTSTCPWSFQGKVKNYAYKTVRYPGHYEKIKCMMDLGLLDTTPVKVNGCEVAPRDVFHAVVPSHIDFPEDKDLVVLRATCKGTKSGKAKTLCFEMILFQDEKTGFSAMEMGTGFPAALVLIHAARGQAQKGVVSLEKALDNAKYMEELIRNGLPIEKMDS